MKNYLIQNSDQISEKKINWEDVQIVFKEKFGNEIFESWLKKIVFVEEYKNYLLLSVSTRFIRDWITSRYLDQILQIIKIQKKGIIRVEFIIDTVKDSKLTENKTDLKSLPNKNISFLKDSYLQYNRIDPNKNFENFVIGESNKLAFEASKKVSNDISHYNPLYIYGGVGMGKTHLLNAIGLKLKNINKVMFLSLIHI